jgi:diacylglycerol kinase
MSMLPENPSPPRKAASRGDSFCYAFSGAAYVMRTQRNAWIHAVATAGVIALGLWLRLGRIEWAVLFLAIGFVWMAEFINTALETVVDLASPEFHPLAKIGKDVAAAAVLVGAITAVLVGLAILGPALWERAWHCSAGIDEDVPGAGVKADTRDDAWQRATVSREGEHRPAFNRERGPAAGNGATLADRAGRRPIRIDSTDCTSSGRWICRFDPATRRTRLKQIDSSFRIAGQIHEVREIARRVHRRKSYQVR